VILCANYYYYAHNIYMPIAADIREKRQEAILDILATRKIARQSEFVRLLQADGIEATQSSVSRDLRELGITKLDDGYGRVTAISMADDMMEVPAGYVREVLSAGDSLTVIKTATGAAQRVALYLDRSNWPEIVGTVSGDDTIFVASRNAKEQKQLMGRLRTL
jgi:transcriptional regulator of arginine metabolism